MVVRYCRRESKAAVSPQWQRIYDANYHRSLDHRSFYFKQVDKRHLGAKGMLQVRHLAPEGDVHTQPRLIMRVYCAPRLSLWQSPAK